MTAARPVAPGAPGETLRNGLRVGRLPGRFPWVGAGLWWQAGSRHEPADCAGLAHCLEHLWFAGTAWDHRIDALGGRVNAETGRELCGLYGVAPAASAAELAHLLAEAFLAPTLDADGLAAELPAMRAELAALRADAGERAMQRAIARAWSGHPAARAPEGTADTLARVDAQRLATYRDARLHAGRVVLVLLGDWPPADLGPLTRGLEALPSGQTPRMETLIPRACHEPLPAEACHLVWALPAADGETAALTAELLAGGLGSRLFRRLRRDRGALYDIQATTECIADAALCLIRTTAPAGGAREITAAVEQELDALAEHGPSPGELAAASARQAAANALQGLAPEDWLRRRALAAVSAGAEATDPGAPFRAPRVRVAEPLHS